MVANHLLSHWGCEDAEQRYNGSNSGKVTRQAVGVRIVSVRLWRGVTESRAGTEHEIINLKQ